MILNAWIRWGMGLVVGFMIVFAYNLITGDTPPPIAYIMGAATVGFLIGLVLVKIVKERRGR